MSSFLSPKGISCPRCKTRVGFGDVFIINPSDGSKLAIGNATRVILDPCGCAANSGDQDFRALLYVVEYLADPEMLKNLAV